MKCAPFFLLGVLISLTNLGAFGDDRTVRFFGESGKPILPSGMFDPRIPTPDQVLGYPLGSRPARQADVLRYFELLAESTPRVKLVEMGKTFEGRRLVYAVITDESNMQNLTSLRENLNRIADPRTLSGGEVSSAVDKTPAVVWLAYSIHGDEISGVDASLAVACHLSAAEDDHTRKMRKELITIIDPMENPDGRERYLAQLESFTAAESHADGQSLQKGGFWPWGRGNHYLFDMNRDWFTQELPESKARIKAIVEWNPQVLVDAHEMGQWDTYLFSPPRHPINPQITKRIREWWDLFAADQAKAYDAHGWAYYTREWNEEWFPGYGSSWPLYQGAVGILYEQAGVSGSRISRHDGTVMTYSESVEHHYVSSMANLATAARNKQDLLMDYHEHRAMAVAAHGNGSVEAFLVRPDQNRDRIDFLASTLERQGIEVARATEAFTLSARSYYQKKAESTRFPEGTMIVRTDQPEGFLIQTILGFDPHLSDSFLVEERRELLKHRSSRLYEITSWSLLQAYGLDAFESESAPSVESVPWTMDKVTGTLLGTAPLQGFMFEASNDRALRAIGRLMDRELTLYAASKELRLDGKTFARGSIFVPRRANAGNYEDAIREVATQTGITVHPIHSGLGNPLGPDIGGEELQVLRKPAIALVTGSPTSFTHVGWIWHLLDQKIGVPVSLLDVSQLGNIDLSIYNVLILPPGGYQQAMGKPTVDQIGTWTKNGGTLIAIGSAAGFCADSTMNLSTVRTREAILPKLAEFQQSTTDELASERPDLQGMQIWEYAPPAESSNKDEDKKAGPPRMKTMQELRREDELGTLFSPHGAILKVELDQEEWLGFGLGKSVPVMITGSTVLMSKHPPVRTVGRFADAANLRISGLLWPEARLRIAKTSYLTREQSGEGQVILFADQPNFRAFFRGAERLLSNAVLYGPGMGTYWTPEGREHK